jgi:hypothetical protein
MAKKSSGKHYTSKGERVSSISTKNTDPGQRLLNQLKALNKGKNVVITLPENTKTLNKKGEPMIKMVKTKIDGKLWLKKRQGGDKKEMADAE